MFRKRPREPIGPTTIPDLPRDPKNPADQAPEHVDRPVPELDRRGRHRGKAAEPRITRFPPG
jgi:hypothetical protein